MTDHHDLIVELEDKAANCKLLGSLAADPQVREENNKRVTWLEDQARALRDTTALRLIVQG